MYQALYRKYRPSNFDEVVGQKVIVTTLKNAILNNQISHAYLFSGPRGTGKTTIAKVLAKTINCEKLVDYCPCDNYNSCININNKKNIDIIEIDAASNNGVEEIRELKNSVNLVPSESKYKVYIIDEVHMLTISAFNALLKTLEEPPKHVVFILATTEIHKVPETIKSRCQKFEFKKISNDDIVIGLKKICSKENISINDEALYLISKYSNGGMRDAVNLLDQVAAYSNNNITINDINEICGNISREQMYELIQSLFQSKIDITLNLIDKFDRDGKNLLILFNNIIEYLKDLLIYINVSNYFKDDNLLNEYKHLANLVNEKNIYEYIKILLEYSNNMKYENNKLLLAELAIIKIFNINQNISQNNNLDNIKKKNNDLLIKENKSKNVEKVDNINNIDIKKLDKLKKIRVNNALANFNKKDLNEFNTKLETINSLLMNPDYSKYVSLILDGSLKIKGNEYLVFVYENNQMSLIFNSELEKIEKLFVNQYHQDFKLIAIDNNEWNIYKKDFNESLKNGNNKYQFIEENPELLKFLKKEESKIKNNDIDNLFSEIVQYE